MGRTVAELTETLSAQEFAMWCAFDRIEPIGALRGDVQAGVIASTVANVNRGKNTRAYTPADFMLYSKTSPITDDQIEAKINAFMSRYN